MLPSIFQTVSAIHCTLIKMYQLILVIFIAYIGLSNACSCSLQPGWQDEFYCRSTWGGTFKVISPEYDCSTADESLICYSIIDLDQMRGVPTYLTYAITRRDSSMCGTRLAVGHTYFIGGYADYNEHSIGVGLCMLLEDWTNLSCKEIEEKKRHYRQLDCGDGLTTPQQPECVRTNKIVDIKYLLCRLRKLLTCSRLRSNKNCKCN